jgi:Spy/CpxP family protein refolding chaperone
MKHIASKSTLVLVTATLLIAGSAFAQQERGGRDVRGGSHGPHDAETRVAHMSRQLDLSDEQSVQLLLVMQAAEEEREALHESIMEQIEPELCELQVSTEAEIRSILTEDQQAEMDAMKQERGENRGARPSRGMGNLDCSTYE